MGNSNKKKFRYLFIVQGEGRGHMTQAIALSNFLVSAGHEIGAVMIGQNGYRKIPAFFHQSFDCPVIPFRTPGFVMDKKRQGIRIFATIFNTVIRLPIYIKSLLKLRNEFLRYKPDIIINFYEVIGGWAGLFYKNNSRIVCLGHQYLMEHPGFQHPEGHRLDRWMIGFNTWVTRFRSDRQLALSFRQMEDLPKNRLFVTPPLLRQAILEAQVENGDFLLAYILNDGYAEDIKSWSHDHMDITIHGFWDRKGVSNPLRMSQNLIFHQIDDKQFIDFMRRCRAYVSTAGFESICEAMYLGKPVMMVPTGGHFEQLCNALDGVKAGAGVSNTHFDLEPLMNHLENRKEDNLTFRKWVAMAQDMFLKYLTEWP